MRTAGAGLDRGEPRQDDIPQACLAAGSVGTDYISRYGGIKRGGMPVYTNRDSTGGWASQSSTGKAEAILARYDRL
ncbi:hypothetical protein LQV63_15925 [Paenibacillus profundus]|uniref:Uncharacterized protein n=1 Tax=Paenibacillus profundus TaxID=1173085 RepID=A0ABS8YIM9_9BACL|nr:hypothetical protein [Paenibacillus profundus]MCE5170794.1 hypothetical protein [Paenibacillus profundus]